MTVSDAQRMRAGFDETESDSTDEYTGGDCEAAVVDACFYSD